MDKWDLWSTSVTMISDKIEVFCASLSWPECFESCEAGIALGLGMGVVGWSVRDEGCHVGGLR